MEFANNRIVFFKNSFSTSLVGQNCLVAMMQVCIFATELFLAVMTLEVGACLRAGSQISFILSTMVGAIFRPIVRIWERIGLSK